MGRGGLPGLVLMSTGNGQEPTSGASAWARWVAFAVVTAFLVGIWWLNQLVARKLQRHIDEIDALTGGRE